jgi:hypothetical protein
VGWYLMLLPKSDPSLGAFPVSWDAIQRSFDTAKECEEARAKAVVPPGPAVAAPLKHLLNGLPPLNPTASQSAQPTERDFYCVSTDDVRLKSDLSH